MKNTKLTLILLAVLAFACNQNDGQTESTENQTETPEVPAPPQAEVLSRIKR